MDVIKCSLPSIVTEYLNTKDTDLEVNIIKHFANNLNCLEDPLCIKETEKCNSVNIHNCKLYIKEFQISFINDIYTITPILVNNIGNIQYNWDINTTLLNYVNGTNSTSNIIQVSTVDDSVTLVDINLTVLDEEGCNDSILTISNFCGDCLETDLEIEFLTEDCWKEINGEYLIPIHFKNVCESDEDFLNKIKNVTVTSTDIGVKKIGSTWYIYSTDLQADIDRICKEEFLYMFYKGNLVMYDVANNTLPGGFFGNIIQPGTITGGIALSDNIFYMLNGNTLEAFSIVKTPFSKTTLYTKTLTLGSVSGNGMTSIDDGSILGLTADATILFINNISTEIWIYDTVSQQETLFLNITDPSVDSVWDMMINGNNLFVSCMDNLGNSSLRVYDIITKTLLQNTAFPYPIHAIMKFDSIYFYVVDGNSNNLVRLEFLPNGLFNTGGTTTTITNFGIDFPYYGVGSLDSVEGSEIDIKVDYTYCNNIQSVTNMVEFPCENPLCCETCELDLDITYLEDCLIPHVLGGVEGYKVEINITHIGCDDLILNTSQIYFDNNNVTGITLLQVITEGNKTYLFSEHIDITDLTYYYDYVSCDENKTFTRNLTSTINTLCCETCELDYTFSTGISDTACIKEETTYWEIEGFANINCPTDSTLGSLTTFDIMDGTIKIGEVIKISGIAYFRIDNIYTLSNICNKSLYLRTERTECGSLIEYTSNNFGISCDLELCDECYDCDDPNLVNYSLDINDLCFSQNNLGEWEALLPNYLECLNEKITDFTMSVIATPTGCTFTTKKVNGQWYLVFTGNCTELANGTLTIQICWNECP